MPRTAAHAYAIATAVALALASAPRSATAQTHDPRQIWMTFETAHFRVHHYQGLEPAARRVAAIGEGIYERVGHLLGWRPRQIVEIVLSDNSDDANGSAISVPFNTISLFVTAPEDLFIHGDYDDWLQGLVLHEFTHIAHTDNISGLPAIINAILGKVYPPNAVQPRWIVEGLAVYVESTLTTGGRLQSSVWDMFLRGEVLGNTIMTLDQIGHVPNRWPHGNTWYLYGSYFIEYLAQRFGPQFIARISTEYGGTLVPFGINRVMQHVTGYTYEQLYPDFVAYLRQRYARQRDAVVARGLEEGERLTFHGEEQFYPRFLPDGHTVMYESNDSASHVQLRTVDLASRPGAPPPRPADGPWIQALNGFAFDSTGRRMIISDTAFHRDIYFYYDLYERRLRFDHAVTEDSSRLLSDGWRARYPDISPDDDHVTFTVNHRGTSSLFEMSLTDRQPTPLFRVHRYEQVYTPRYSPDGASIAFSHWQSEGYRDIRVIDRATHAIRDVTHDRHVDMQPVFSPDGRYVVFASDRTGIFNLYAYELSTGLLRQVTEVMSGAFMPAISPDGHTLVYVGYSNRGYDLYRLPFDPSRWRTPGPERTRSGERLPTPEVQGTLHRYNPLLTLYPRTWSAEISDDGFGPSAAIITGGRDVVGNHSWSARVGVSLTQGHPSVDLSYSFGGLRPSFRVHLYRSVSAASWRVGTGDHDYPSARWGGDTEVSYYFPSLFMSHGLSLSYEAQYVHAIGGFPFGPFVDPNETPQRPPFQGWNSGVRGSWRFSRTQRYTYSISNQEGVEGSVGAHVTDRALGGSYSSFDMSGAFAAYVPMPWSGRRRHVLAFRFAGGFGVSDGEPAIFHIGGFPVYGIQDFIGSLVSLSSGPGVALRGYPQYGRGGNQFVMGNMEYRFPIWQVDRGVTTLPVYLARIYGGAFLDVGTAYFGRFRFETLAVGVGAELLADVVFGYVLPYTVRVGLARGLTGDDGQWQGYFLFSSPF